jgi:hypothetical protein
MYTEEEGPRLSTPEAPNTVEGGDEITIGLSTLQEFARLAKL